MAVRMNIVVADGIPELLTELAGGERRRGDWISETVKAIADGRASGQIKEERLQAQIDGMLVKLAQVDARLAELEQIARRGF